MQNSLSDWFSKEVGISISLISRNEDFGILKLKLVGPKENGTYLELDSESVSESLKRLTAVIDQPISQNFQTIPDLRIFVGDSLYLIKPLQLRFWLPSSALADADGIASDLQTLVELESKRGLAS